MIMVGTRSFAGIIGNRSRGWSSIDVPIGTDNKSRSSSVNHRNVFKRLKTICTR